MSQKTITLIGPFTDDDVATFMEALRHCERQQPDQNFLMMVQDDTKSVTNMKEFLKKRFPAVKGQPVTIETFNNGGILDES
jgi:hypothetical protein